MQHAGGPSHPGDHGARDGRVLVRVPVVPREHVHQSRPADGRVRECTPAHARTPAHASKPAHARTPAHASKYMRTRTHARVCTHARTHNAVQIQKLKAIKVALTLRKLGIDHVKGTIVGNDLVRA